MTSRTVVPIQIAANRRHREGLPDGWRPIFDHLMQKLAELDPMPILVTADQRFGKLLIRCVHLDERAAEMVEEAVDAAATACDRCGDAGVLRRTPDAEWARRCSLHFDLPAQFPSWERRQTAKQRSSPSFDGRLALEAAADPRQT